MDRHCGDWREFLVSACDPLRASRLYDPGQQSGKVENDRAGCAQWLRQFLRIAGLNGSGAGTSCRRPTAYTAIYFMVLVSIVSAVDYFQAFWKQIDHSSSDRRKASVVLRRDKKNTAPVN